MVTNTAIIMIMVGNFFYAYQCIFQTRSYIQKYGFGEGSAIMTRLVGTFAAGFGIILLIALLTTIKGGWLLFTYGFIQAVIGAVVCYRTINSEWGIIEGLKTSPEGYIAPGVVAVLNLVVLITGKELLFM